MSFDLGQIKSCLSLFVVLGGGIFVLLLEAFSGDDRRKNIRADELSLATRGRTKGHLLWVTVLTCILALGADIWLWRNLTAETATTAFSGLLARDHLSIYLDVFFLLATVVTAFVAENFWEDHEFVFGEFYALLLFATFGMMVLGAATDFVSLFIGLETMSLAVYVLVGSWNGSARSAEAAMKYFLSGSVASAILLYGMALVYGASGTTSLGQLTSQAAQYGEQPIYIIGMLLVLVGVAFKIAAVPFHMWTPDAYDGAPTPVTGFMSAAVKAAAFATLLRLVAGPFARPDLTYGSSGWATLLAAISVITMTVGNLAALKQSNIKRMLAYSSIAHAGYLLLGIVAMSRMPEDGRASLLVYLVTYGVTTLGSFAVVSWLTGRDNRRNHLDDWAGLASRFPLPALAMTLFMLSLGGVPPTAGFFGKFYLFRAILQVPGMLHLAVVAIANSVVSVAYYLRVVTTMYFREVGREPEPSQGGKVTLAIACSAVLVLLLGILPQILEHFAVAATLGK